MIYRVRHLTRYAYGSPVDLAAHIVHVTPRDLPGQVVCWTRLDVTPAPARRVDGLDYFGNRIAWLYHEAPHRTFDVLADSEVDVSFAPPPPDGATPAWEDLVAIARGGGDPVWDVAEFLFDSPMCAANRAAGDYAALSFTPGRPVLAALLELNRRIYTEFRFRAGVTTLSTPIEQTLTRREGVCQDFTHLMVSALRWIGVPARYMSGYIRTRPPPGQKRRLGADQSHAWVAAWLGPDHGWVGLDPTNGIVVRDEHVVLGWGRDYADISPVHGLILGGGNDVLTVGVDLVPADEWPDDLAGG
ncbi:transglutaminase domain protein [Gluconacetobacter diazotrophicus PA1 5]|uniref:Putative transglutaminase-like protein n=1 Tax=Gluconacetobacter diazotrophicus (strain ATCC 49037 / DSM 5601 / CCUG 37298 / CIP 103539 / LMG 7603 / PAl5) TaxID=272568 RepID=A9H291_GLUDA|nr:transglutaminase family protein [Gluconacetobacter diazotrophicus]ACI52004.1 transglutaminase domain protein [Gluconacetobacter diazotrophicus PA1 5]TWB05197.1 transglutaminase-like putative cysteine protease [Gluconacetobacter diazotrophicus]CAP54122.1 putative transglutaminase-like protein [Gluconacetobacter diazotrophicus PA1 5]